MKLFKKIAAISAALLIVLSLSACSNELAGKWRSTSEKHTLLAFSSTGRVTMSADGIELNGTYELKDGSLIMELEAPDGELYTISAKYMLGDKKLYLENDKGQVEIFER